MKNKRLSLQISAIFTVIAAAFLGSALLVFRLQSQMLKDTVESETNLYSSLVADSLDTDFTKEEFLSGTYDKGRLQGILSEAGDMGVDLDVWIISGDGTIYSRNGDPAGGNLFQNAEGSYDESMIKEAGKTGAFHGWLGTSKGFFLRQNYCVTRTIFEGSLYLVIVNYCNDALAMQRQQFALYGGIDAALLIIVLVLIANLIYNYRRQVIRLATTDELTGLMNRRYFNTEFQEFMRKGHGPASLFLLDIDFFKQINDGYGHAAGDSALRYLADRIREALKETGGFAGRWGGDEFIGVLHCSGEEAGKALRALCENVRESEHPEGFTMTISAGTTEIGSETDLAQLTERADAALYASKEGGRNQATVYRPGMTTEGAEAVPAAMKVQPAQEKEKSEENAPRAETNEPVFRERLRGNIRKKLIPSILLGVRWMAPFVAGGGILIAMAFLFDAASVDLSTLSVEARAGFGSITPLARTLKDIGGITFNFMLPVFAGFMAHGLAGEDAFMAGFVGGYMTIQSNAGFVGAMIAGFAAGLIANEIQQFTGRLPKLIRNAAPIIIYPVFNLILMQAISTLVITPVASGIGVLFTQLLDRAVASSNVAAGGLSAMMMAVDMGGIINKVAYNYGVEGLYQNRTIIMASVMIGGMVPPIAIFISMVLFPSKFSEEEWERGPGALFMGLSFITEGALPYVFADPLRVIPSCMAGSAIAGTLSALYGCSLPAPHGGMFVFPVMEHALLYILALLLGSFVGAVIMGVRKSEKRKDKESFFVRKHKELQA